MRIFAVTKPLAFLFVVAGTAFLVEGANLRGEATPSIDENKTLIHPAAAEGDKWGYYGGGGGGMQQQQQQQMGGMQQQQQQQQMSGGWGGGQQQQQQQQSRGGWRNLAEVAEVEDAADVDKTYFGGGPLGGGVQQQQIQVNTPFASVQAQQQQARDQVLTVEKEAAKTYGYYGPSGSSQQQQQQQNSGGFGGGGQQQQQQQQGN